MYRRFRRARTCNLVTREMGENKTRLQFRATVFRRFGTFYLVTKMETANISWTKFYFARLVRALCENTCIYSVCIYIYIYMYRGRNISKATKLKYPGERGLPRLTLKATRVFEKGENQKWKEKERNKMPSTLPQRRALKQYVSRDHL